MSAPASVVLGFASPLCANEPAGPPSIIFVSPGTLSAGRPGCVRSRSPSRNLPQGCRRWLTPSQHAPMLSAVRGQVLSKVLGSGSKGSLPDRAPSESDGAAADDFADATEVGAGVGMNTQWDRSGAIPSLGRNTGCPEPSASQT